jgi:putative pyruvate formate lyase activating enzyme
VFSQSGKLKAWRYLPEAQSITEEAGKSLSRYLSVANNEKPAKFMIARKLPAQFDKNDPIEDLWKEHDVLTRKFCELESAVDQGKMIFQNMPTPAKTYFDLKIEIAENILQSCHLCTRRCGVNRLGEHLGYCRCGSEMQVSSIFAHLGEEPELVPSGTVFTMGCTIRCKHCQNWTISQWEEAGAPFEPEELARKVEQLRLDGCRNINLVGGEPTCWLPQWLNVFKHVDINVPIVWNSNAYYSNETARLLAGFADVYLLDFKYGPENCAARISDAPHYWEVCTRNHLDADKYGELIVRILVLPGHLGCCTRPTFDWIVSNLGKSTRINIMFQYRPEWRAFEVPELRKKLTKAEIEKVLRLAEDVGLHNVV